MQIISEAKKNFCAKDVTSPSPEYDFSNILTHDLETILNDEISLS